MKIRVSVVTVTYNRPKEVKETVESLLNQSVKPFEIIVVDDESHPPVDLKVNFQNFKLIRIDEELGISNARNYGINIAKGEYIAFIDDDCIASKHWLAEIQKGISTGADILGGPLRPRFQSKPPEWWTEMAFGAFAGVGNAEIKEIWGGNMVFKKEFFEKYGLFNPNIGRQKGKLLCDEESELIDRGRAGSKILFLPKAEVFHLVKTERMAIRYILRWSYYSGKTLKIKSGPRPIETLFNILITLITMLNPSVISEKTTRIALLAKMATLFGRIT